MAMIWTTNGGNTPDMKQTSRAGSFLRILALGASWTWIYLRLTHHPHLVHHLLHHRSCLALSFIALSGTIVHVLGYIQMVWIGRFNFENLEYKVTGADDGRDLEVAGGPGFKDLLLKDIGNEKSD